MQSQLKLRVSMFKGNGILSAYADWLSSELSSHYTEEPWVGRSLFPLTALRSARGLSQRIHMLAINRYFYHYWHYKN